jgi:hypothetical protein
MMATIFLVSHGLPELCHFLTCGNVFPLHLNLWSLCVCLNKKNAERVINMTTEAKL